MSDSPFTSFLLGLSRIFIRPGTPGPRGFWWSGLLGWFDPVQELESWRAVLGHKSA